MLIYNFGNFKCIILIIIINIRIKIIIKKNDIFINEINSLVIINNIYYRIKV